MQWNIYIQCGRHICLMEYTNNVKCVYTSVLSHIIDFSGLMLGIYLHELISICGLCVPFEVHINFMHIDGTKTFPVT